MTAASKVSNIDEHNVKLKKQDVVFKGGAGDLLVTMILANLITIFTFGICFPWGLCMMENWRVKNTEVAGMKMEFRGSAFGLFGNWIKWWFFTACTLGIYSFWVIPALNKWKANNTFIVK